MVYQDYELIPTKRVNKDRIDAWVLSRRRFSAIGGYSTLYMAGMFGYLGHLSGMFAAQPISTPIMSAAGRVSLARNVAILSAPAAIGLAVGMASFGDT